MAIEIKIIISTPAKGGAVVEAILAGQPANDREDKLGGFFMNEIAAMVKSLEGGHIMDAGGEPKSN